MRITEPFSGLIRSLQNGKRHVIYLRWMVFENRGFHQPLGWSWINAKVKWKLLSRVRLFYTVHGIIQARILGVGSGSLLQGIFPTQGLNPGLPHCRQLLYQLSHQGSPRTLEGVAYPFSSWSSWPRNQSRVSSTVGGFFTTWTTREAMNKP